MARSKKEIVESIQTVFLANPILKSIYGLPDNENVAFKDEFSLVSLEAQWIEVVGNVAKAMEDLMDVHLEEIQERLSKMVPGTLEWYRVKALEYQEMPEPEWNAERLQFAYPHIDEDAQIVHFVSVNETDEGLLMKVAKEDAEGDPEKLSEIQLIAFKAYMNAIKYAGVQLTVLSRDADIINLKLKIYYNPMVLTEDGALLTQPDKFPIEDAVAEYLKLMPFNGIFNVTDLIDALQKEPGVINPLFVSAKAQSGSVWVAIEDYYQSNAGYIVINDLNIEYIAR
ncbi:MAG: hypothetical protein LC105_04290 [Chitinophagales bacterium]|nr:hypothetical protein [Chitinophagales bacterium]